MGNGWKWFKVPEDPKPDTKPEPKKIVEHYEEMRYEYKVEVYTERTGSYPLTLDWDDLFDLRRALNKDTWVDVDSAFIRANDVKEVRIFKELKPKKMTRVRYE